MYTGFERKHLADADAIIAALTAAGYKIVAREPTNKMLMDKAAGDAWPSSPSGFWRAMWNAAP